MINRVLFITMHQLVGNSGGSLATRAAYRIVSEVFAGRCRIVAPAESAQAVTVIPHETFIPVESRGLLQKAFYFTLARNADRFSPYVDQHLSQLLDGVSHVFLDGSMIGRFAKLVKRIAPQIYVAQLHHNFERAYYTDVPMNAFKRLQHNRIIDRNQGDGWKHADLNLVFTHKDLDDLTNYYSTPGVRAEVYGYYESIIPYVKRTSHSENKPLCLAITGNMAIAKGYDGVIWFLNNVWPSVNPNDYRLIIAGRNPVQVLQQTASAYSNVEVVANPEDMAQVLCNADIYLNPCSGGSGIKIRNLDGLRTGLPTLCRRGNEYGFEMLPQDVFAVFENEGDFFSKLKALDTRNSTNVRNAYETHFLLQTGIDRLRGLLRL